MSLFLSCHGATVMDINFTVFYTYGFSQRLIFQEHERESSSYQVCVSSPSTLQYREKPNP